MTVPGFVMAGENMVAVFAVFAALLEPLSATVAGRARPKSRIFT